MDREKKNQPRFWLFERLLHMGCVHTIRSQVRSLFDCLSIFMYTCTSTSLSLSQSTPHILREHLSFSVSLSLGAAL